MAKIGGRRLPMGISMERGKYRVRLYVDGFQHSLGMYATLTDAKAALAIARAQKVRGNFVPPAERRRLAKEREEQAKRGLTVEQWSERWLQDLRLNGKAVGTLRAHRSLLHAHILPVIGGVLLSEVTPADIATLVIEVKAKPSRRHMEADSNGVWPNVVRTLRAMFNAAVDDPTVPLEASPVRESVAKDVRVVKAEEGADVATPAEVRALAEAMPPDLAIAVPLAAWCALRLGEVLGLQRADFDDLDTPEKAVLHVRRQWNTKATPPAYTPPKADSARTVSIPAALVPEIRAHLETYTGPDKTAPLIPSPRTPGQPVSQTRFDAAWRKARSGVRPGFRFHALRHTGLTLYAQQGATLQELMKRGGHKSLDVALRYQHASQERDRALTNKLDRVIGGE